MSRQVTEHEESGETNNRRADNRWSKSEHEQSIDPPAPKLRPSIFLLSEHGDERALNLTAIRTTFAKPSENALINDDVERSLNTNTW